MQPCPALAACFSWGSLAQQGSAGPTETVGRLLAEIERALEGVAWLDPQAHWTGDGILASIGMPASDTSAPVELDADVALAFVRSAHRVSLRANEVGCPIRAGVAFDHYGRLVPIPAPSRVAASYVQIGQAVSDAMRLIELCEPGELLLTDSVIEHVRAEEGKLPPAEVVGESEVSLDSRLRFRRNPDVRTRDRAHLRTWSYVPGDEERLSGAYHPDAAIHAYKRYIYFPPIRSETLEFFVQHRLVGELHATVADAYAAMSHLDTTKTFASRSSVVQLLMNMRYDPTDEVLVVWRADSGSRDFWKQRHASSYLEYLRAQARRHGLNQTRLVVVADKAPQVPSALRDAHRPGSLLAIPHWILPRYPRLSALKFGFTLSTRNRYALIAMPAEGLERQRFSQDDVEMVLSDVPPYASDQGPMKALVTADPVWVQALEAEVRALLDDYGGEQL